jgi:hypothetical protein
LIPNIVKKYCHGFWFKRHFVAGFRLTFNFSDFNISLLISAVLASSTDFLVTDLCTSCTRYLNPSTIPTLKVYGDTGLPLPNFRRGEKGEGRRERRRGEKGEGRGEKGEGRGVRGGERRNRR